MSPDDFDFLDDQLGSLKSIAEDAGTTAHGLHTRMLSDDIPWGAGLEVSEEFCSYIHDLETAILTVEKSLRERFQTSNAQD